MPGMLQLMGSQKIGHDLVNEQQQRSPVLRTSLSLSPVLRKL